MRGKRVEPVLVVAANRVRTSNGTFGLWARLRRGEAFSLSKIRSDVPVGHYDQPVNQIGG